MTFRRTVAVGLLICVVGCVAYGQKNPAPADKQLKIKVDKLVKKIVDIKAAGAADSETQIRDQFEGGDINIFLLSLLPYENFVTLIEEARVDKQVGTSNTNAGGTSLVSKGSVPSIIGLAVENGALKRETNGTSMTFSGNPVGIIKALGDKGFISSYDDDSPITRRLRDLAFSFTVDTSRGDQPGTFTGSLNQLSSYSFRYSFINKRDPRNSAYQAKWSDIIAKYGHDITKQSALFQRILREEPLYSEWLKAAQDRLVKATADEVDHIVREELVNLRKISMPPELQQIVNRYNTSVNAFLENRAHILEQAANGSILTFEFTTTRPVNEPDTANFKLIYENSFQGRAEFTANGSFTILNKKPDGMNQDRVRDYQAALQLDLPLSNPAKKGNFVLSFSYKLQHMMDDTMTPTGMVIDTDGNIHIGQIKLMIPVKGTGFKVPLSVTFANRTDLIKEKSFVRGNFGLTFDLDSLFSKLKP